MDNFQAYGDFARVYDMFQDNVDYQTWGKWLKQQLAAQGITDGLVLDLGCGWGPVGVALGALYPDCQIVFTDVNLRALSLAEQNAKANQVTGMFIQSDGFAGIDGMFDYIITNPPIRAGKETIYRMFADSAAHLNPNGQLYLVISKQQGAPSALKYLSTLFVSAEVIEKSGGYWVIRCMNGGAT